MQDFIPIAVGNREEFKIQKALSLGVKMSPPKQYTLLKVRLVAHSSNQDLFPSVL